MIFDPKIIDKKVFFKSLIMILLVMGLMKVTGGAGFALVVPLAFGAFFKKKPEEVLFWVVVSTIMLVGNSYLMPKDQIFMLAQKGMLMAFGVFMLLQMTNKRKVPSVAPYLLLLPYLLFMIFPSALGWMPVISYLKLFLFTIVYFALMGVANDVSSLSRLNLPNLRAMLLAALSFLIMGSIALIPFPAISQLTGEEYLTALASGGYVVSLFKGITFQSQALGPIIVMAVLFLFADWVLAVRKWSNLHALLILCSPYLIYKTSSRTAMASMILGFFVVGYCVMRERGIGARWRGKVKGTIFAVVIVCVIAVIAVPALRDSVARFALKYNTTATTSDFSFEDATKTRQGLMDSAMANFKKKPVIGNGFQVADYTAYKKLNSLKDYLSSPIEKGVWVTAILEEGGVIGFLLFLMFVVVGGFQLLVSRSYVTLSLFAGMLFLNLGEFSIFSISGTGGFFWTITFVGAAFDALRLRDDYIKRSHGDYS